eukprot:scpid67867/ scgid8040/ 
MYRASMAFEDILQQQRFLYAFCLLMTALVTVETEKAEKTFTVVDSIDCRYKYGLLTGTSGACGSSRCWMAPSLFHTQDFSISLSRHQLCMVRAPRNSRYVELYFSIADVGYPSANCSWTMLQDRVTLYKILSNGSRLNIYQDQGRFNFHVDVGNASKPWCSSKHLLPVKDPYSDRCRIGLRLLDVEPLYEGIWQFAVQPAPGSAVAPALHQFHVQWTESLCDTCFGAGSKCERISFSSVYPRQVLSEPTSAVTPRVFKIPTGQSKCFVFVDTQDTHGGWLVANGATSMLAQPVQYTEPREADDSDPGADPTNVTVYRVGGLTAFGDYHQCLHIDQMAQSLAGLVFYEFSDAYALAHNNTATVPIRIEVGEPSGVEEQIGTTSTTIGLLVWCTVLTLVSLWWKKDELVACCRRHRPGYQGVQGQGDNV